MATQIGPLQTSNSSLVITSHVRSSHPCPTAAYLQHHHHYLDQEGGHQQARMEEEVEKMASAVEAIGVAMDEEEEGEAVDLMAGG